MWPGHNGFVEKVLGLMHWWPLLRGCIIELFIWDLAFIYIVVVYLSSGVANKSGSAYVRPAHKQLFTSRPRMPTHPLSTTTKAGSTMKLCCWVLSYVGVMVTISSHH